MGPRSHQPMLQLPLVHSYPIPLSQPTGHQCWRYVRTHCSTLFLSLNSFTHPPLSLSHLSIFLFTLSSPFLILSFFLLYLSLFSWQLWLTEETNRQKDREKHKDKDKLLHKGLNYDFPCYVPVRVKSLTSILVLFNSWVELLCSS